MRVPEVWFPVRRDKAHGTDDLVEASFLKGCNAMGNMDVFVSHVLDLLKDFGSVTAKPMFGGHGIYRDGIIFAIVVKGALYLKADDTTRSRFTKKGLTRFTYLRKGKECAMSYYLVPEEALEDRDELCDWSREAFEAALRSRK